MNKDPTEIAGPFTMQEIQSLLRNEISMFHRLATPDGMITKEAAEQALEQIRAKRRPVGKSAPIVNETPESQKKS